MRTKPQSVPTYKTERQVVDEKVGELNKFLKKIDIDQLYKTIEQVRQAK